MQPLWTHKNHLYINFYLKELVVAFKKVQHMNKIYFQYIDIVC